MLLPTAQSILPPALMRLAFGLHIAGGTVGLPAGTVAMLSAKVRACTALPGQFSPPRCS